MVSAISTSPTSLDFALGLLRSPLAARAASALILAGIFGALWQLAHLSALREKVTLECRALSSELRFLRSRWTVGSLLGVLGGSLLASLGVAWLVSPWLGIPLASAVLAAPHPVLKQLRKKRVAQMEEQLAGWLTALANALEASGALGDALRESLRLIERPLRDEVEQVLDEVALGTPLDRALLAAGRRIDSRLVSAAILTLQIARNTGGRVIQVLREGAANLREMARLEGVIRTKTAEGKAQAVVISAIPLPMYGGVRFLSPGFFDPLEQTFVGHVVLGISFALWMAAALLARRILAVEV